jgi:hypothetical protein
MYIYPDENNMRTGRKRHGNYSDDKNADEVYQPAFFF